MTCECAFDEYENLILCLDGQRAGLPFITSLSRHMIEAVRRLDREAARIPTDVEIKAAGMGHSLDREAAKVPTDVEIKAAGMGHSLDREGLRAFTSGARWMQEQRLAATKDDVQADARIQAEERERIARFVEDRYAALPTFGTALARLIRDGAAAREVKS